jgi:hypothetical protein
MRILISRLPDLAMSQLWGKWAAKSNAGPGYFSAFSA